MEIWKDVLGYDGSYQVSNYGNVKSLRFGKEKLMKPGIDGMGYKHVVLSKAGKKLFKVHQLVAMVFLGHIPNGHKIIVNHKDFDKTNNRIDNLEVITQRENTNRKHIKHTSKHTGVSWYNRTNKWRASINVDSNSIHLGYFISEVDANNAYQKALFELNQR